MLWGPTLLGLFDPAAFICSFIYHYKIRIYLETQYKLLWLRVTSEKTMEKRSRPPRGRVFTALYLSPKSPDTLGQRTPNTLPSRVR